MLLQLEKSLAETKLRIINLQKEKDIISSTCREFELHLQEALAKLAAVESKDSDTANELAVARQHAKVVENMLAATKEELGAVHQKCSEWAEKYKVNCCVVVLYCIVLLSGSRF